MKDYQIEETQELIIDCFSEIVKNETLKTESLKEMLHNVSVAKMEIESGIDVDLSLGLLEFVR